MKQARRAERVVVCLTAFALSSCATSPYIANTRPTAPGSAAGLALAATASGQTSALPGTLPYALAYADATYDAYRAKLGEEFTRQQQLSNGLLTLGALTVGAAIGKAHRDVVITAALGGGLAYQLGTWNSNDGRLGIYLEGMKAMACVKAAVAPLRVSEETRKRMDKSERLMLVALSNASVALADTTRWLDFAGASQVLSADTALSARTEISEATALFSQANDLLKLSNGFGQKVDGAGAMLEPKIDAIQGLIDEALKGTLSKLSSLPQQISSITQYANVFAPGLSLNTTFDDRIAGINGILNPKKSTAEALVSGTSPTTPPALDPRAELSAALGRLIGARVVLAARMAALSGAIERPNTQVQADLATCGVDTTKLSQGISLDRSQIVLTAGQAGTSWVSVAGGTMPYTATPMDTPTKGITVVAPAGGAVVMVVADAATVAGSTYKVRVEDSAKAAALLTIKVEAKADALAAAADRTCGGFDAKNSALTCLVQNVVGAKPTGLMDSDTCARFTKLAPNGQLDDQSKATVFAAKGLAPAPTVQQILNKLSSDEQKSCKVGSTTEARRKPVIPKTSANAPAEAKTAYERSISADEVMVLSGKLKMQPTTRDLDDRFRRALADYQQRNGLGDTKGELTEPVFKRLMNQ